MTSLTVTAKQVPQVNVKSNAHQVILQLPIHHAEARTFRHDSPRLGMGSLHTQHLTGRDLPRGRQVGSQL